MRARIAHDAAISPDTLIGFAGDGTPDTGWLGVHAAVSREEGNDRRADAIDRMITTFNKYVTPTMHADRELTAVGQYRLFEFAVALECQRVTRIAGTQVSAVRDDSLRELLNKPTYEMAAAEEIRACQENFLCTTGFAEELDSASRMSRWIDTVPLHPPDELRDFVNAYSRAMKSVDGALSHSGALRRFTRDLGVSLRCSEEMLGAASGRVHASRVLLFLAVTADV